VKRGNKNQSWHGLTVGKSDRELETENKYERAANSWSANMLVKWSVWPQVRAF